MAINSRTKAPLKRWMYQCQKGRCKYCESPMTLAEATFDHVVPRSGGGKGRRDNLVLACLPCNRKKGCKPPHIWHMELMTGEAA